MKNKKQRQEFIRNDQNWEVIDTMQFAVLKRLTYKGDSWLKIQHLIEGRRYSFEDHDYHFATQLDDMGIYILNEDGTALVRSSETAIVDRISELDKQFPDRTGGGPLPKTLDIDRKGERE